VPDTPWTVQDYVAHLATIDGLIAAGFQRFSGQSIAPEPDIPAADPFDIDDWNEAAVTARRGAGVDDLLAEAARHREDLVAVFSTLEDAQLGTPVPFGARRATGLPDVMVPLREILWAIALHDPGHTADILRALPAKAEAPQVKEWLASAGNDTVHPDIVARRL
jgi:DinB superfamily